MSFHVPEDPLSYIASGPWKVSKAVGVGVVVAVCGVLWMCMYERKVIKGTLSCVLGVLVIVQIVATSSCINITSQEMPWEM